MTRVATRRCASDSVVGLSVLVVVALLPSLAAAQARELPVVASRLDVLSSLASDMYRPPITRPPVVRPIDRPAEAPSQRPRPLVPLYATFGLLQVLDGHSTRRALEAGAVERNPVVAPFGRNAGAMFALKAATTAGTIVIAERLWRRHPAAAVAVLTVINAAYAAIVASNYRNARRE